MSIEETIDAALPLVRNALIMASKTDYEQAGLAGISEEEMANIVVADSIRLILESAEIIPA